MVDHWNVCAACGCGLACVEVSVLCLCAASTICAAVDVCACRRFVSVCVCSFCVMQCCAMQFRSEQENAVCRCVAGGARRWINVDQNARITSCFAKTKALCFLPAMDAHTPTPSLAMCVQSTTNCIIPSRNYALGAIRLYSNKRNAAGHHLNSLVAQRACVSITRPTTCTLWVQHET